MKYETVTVASLMLDPANVRKHDHKNIDAIKASYARFGQQKPIVVDGDGIVRDGNGQLMAAKALGMASLAIVRTDLKGAEATAYAMRVGGRPTGGSACFRIYVELRLAHARNWH